MRTSVSTSLRWRFNLCLMSLFWGPREVRQSPAQSSSSENAPAMESLKVVEIETGLFLAYLAIWQVCDTSSRIGNSVLITESDVWVPFFLLGIVIRGVASFNRIASNPVRGAEGYRQIGGHRDSSVWGQELRQLIGERARNLPGPFWTPSSLEEGESRQAPQDIAGERSKDFIW